MELPTHPRLLFNAEGIERLNRRIAGHDWAQARWQEVKAALDPVLANPVELPPRGGGWWHWYACPKHGAPLKRGKQLGPWQWEHFCPVDNEFLPSDPAQPSSDYDMCDIMGAHDQLAATTRNLGIAYQVTGERRYADKAREILLAYAERYLSYPLHTVRNEEKLGGGRVGPQTLDESVWLIPLTQGADLVWEALGVAERETIAGKMLLPAVREVILPHLLGVHNIQCWKNSAVGLVGLLLGDEELIREAIDNPARGYWRQMRGGVSPEGAWWEGAWGYHFYTLSALWSLVEAGRNCGLSLYGEEYKRMFDAPLAFALPNSRLPAFNDSGEVNLRDSAPAYELAYARYAERAYVPLLKASHRRTDYALWFGAGELPDAPGKRWQSANYARSGYALLARGEGEQAAWLCLKDGAHGGGHGHPDKLNFVLYARGRIVSPDVGTARYGLPIQRGWYRTTLAHNALIVDESSQANADARCLAFGSELGVDYVVADAGDIYVGMKHYRSAALLDENLVVLIDQIEADQPHLLDLAYHQYGLWEGRAGDPWTPPEKDGYSYLRDAKSLKSADPLSLATIQQGAKAAVHLAGGELTEAITATGVGAHSEDRVPMVIWRRQAKETAYAWAVALDGAPVKLDWLPVRDADGGDLSRAVAAAAQVTAADGRQWALIANPGGRALRVQAPGGTEWHIASWFAVR